MDITDVRHPRSCRKRPGHCHKRPAAQARNGMRKRNMSMLGPVLPTLGEGNGRPASTSRYFDLNGDGELNTNDFLGL